MEERDVAAVFFIREGGSLKAKKKLFKFFHPEGGIKRMHTYYDVSVKIKFSINFSFFNKDERIIIIFPMGVKLLSQLMLDLGTKRPREVRKPLIRQHLIIFQKKKNRTLKIYVNVALNRLYVYLH